MARLLIILGMALVAAGLLWPWLSRLGIGRLPGDIVFKRGDVTIYFPIVTSLVLSLVLTLIFWLIGR
jgi:hypothetical protein